MTKVSATRAGGMVLTSVLIDGKLVAVLAEHLLQHHLGALDAGLVELALDVEADLLLLEAVHHVRDGDRVQALVVDLADGGLFANVDLQLEAALAWNLLDAHIVEVAGVPERVEVALHHGRVVGVAGAAEQARDDRLFGDAPVADDLDRAKDLRRRFRGELRRGLDLRAGGRDQGWDGQPEIASECSGSKGPSGEQRFKPERFWP